MDKRKIKAGEGTKRTRLKMEGLLFYIGWVSEVLTYKGILRQKRR